MPSDFPDDDTGDALRRMFSSGDRLDIPRDVDFNVVFPTESSAAAFARYFAQAGYKVSVRKSGVREDCPWDVLVVKKMAPTYETITDFEDVLQAIANNFDGQNDGWGCLAQNDPQVN